MIGQHKQLWLVHLLILIHRNWTVFLQINQSVWKKNVKQHLKIQTKNVKSECQKNPFHHFFSLISCCWSSLFACNNRNYTTNKYILTIYSHTCTLVWALMEWRHLYCFCHSLLFGILCILTRTTWHHSWNSLVGSLQPNLSSHDFDYIYAAWWVSPTFYPHLFYLSHVLVPSQSFDLINCSFSWTWLGDLRSQFWYNGNHSNL